ncbi:carbohydrate ABC transporter permease [Embleya sp. NPDC020886]|uniref:carbohydrate ABC transporter permease n=1 Tax=Embleya sp. NPDC020886 TaxID=3363980 RepID=UPI00379D6FAE
MSTVSTADAAPGHRKPRGHKPRKQLDHAQRMRRTGLLLSAPAVTIMLLVAIAPLADAVWLSLFHKRLTTPDANSFAGLSNYWVVLKDPLWWTDVWTTLALTVATVSVEFVIGFGLAWLMQRALYLRRTLRTIVLIPYGIVTVVSAYAWRYAFDPSTGFVNDWFGTDIAWFDHRWSALFVIALSEIWKTTPFMSLLLLAGLIQVSPDVQEAARVDGAGPWQRLTRVTMPIMKQAILVALLFRTMDAFRIFDSVFVMTGGANNTETVSFLAYRQLVSRTALGLGSAISVLLFACVLLIAFLFIKLFRTDVSKLGSPS